MLQKVYSIYSDDLTNQQLYIEVGKNHFACWCKKADEKKITAFEFFQCENYDGSTFENLINQAKLYSKLLTLDIDDTTLIWFTSSSLVLPAEINGDDKFLRDNLSLMHGCDNNEKLISSNYKEYTIVTSIEKYLYNAVQNVFPKAQLRSAFYLNSDNTTQLFFYPYCFSFIVYKENKLQLFQTKYYNNAEDVLYTVLNAFQQYEIEKNTKIITGGFIEEHSKLYELLYQYLEGLEFGSVDENLFVSPEFKDYPAHYFLPYANYLL